MKSPVIIKGNKYGFQIVLNPTLTFEELLAAVEEKFCATDRFFDENRRFVADEKLVSELVSFSAILVEYLGWPFEAPPLTSTDSNSKANNKKKNDGSITEGSSPSFWLLASGFLDV